MRLPYAFTVIVADPPWAFSDSLKAMKDGVQRSAVSQYRTLSIPDIKALPVPKVSASNGCLLALWVPSVLLDKGFEVMQAWGFNFKQTFVWVKTKSDKTVSKALAAANGDLNAGLGFGMGRLFRQTHEIALIGTNNNQIYNHLQNKSQRSVVLAENLGHSTKPEGLQDKLDIMFPSTPKLELFARRQRPGWLCLGNAVCNGEDIRDSMKKLLPADVADVA